MYKMDQKQYLHEIGQNLADLFYNQKNINMKQTAVKWLIEKLQERGYIFEKKENVIIEQAKQMEKEQIINFAYYFKHEEFTKKELEQHFNKTFKSE